MNNATTWLGDAGNDLLSEQDIGDEDARMGCEDTVDDIIVIKANIISFISVIAIIFIFSSIIMSFSSVAIATMVCLTLLCLFYLVTASLLIHGARKVIIIIVITIIVITIIVIIIIARS